MKTKLVKFEAPKESTIYNPPLELTTVEGCSPIYKKLFAFVCDRKMNLIFEESAQVFVDGQYFIEVPDEPQRMTCLQVMQLMDKGGWIAKTVNDEIVNNIRVGVSELLEIVGSKVKVSRIEKIEWIEPTTDLLEL